jgi:hypothetical protein
MMDSASRKDVRPQNRGDLGPEIGIERIDREDVDRATGLEKGADVTREERAGPARKLVGKDREAQAAELRVEILRGASNVEPLRILRHRAPPVRFFST